MNLKNSLVECQNRVNNNLKDFLNKMPDVAPKLKDAMSYGVLLGGKRVRPFLVYSVARALGGEETLADYPAAAIECIHAYSLIHDDLPAMDNDELRRGHPTVHIAHGEATAILAGDALQTMAFEILSNAKMPQNMLRNQVKMLAILANGSGYQGMCGGQELDLEAEGTLVDQTQLEKIHRHKTGALIESAVKLGLLCVENVDTKTEEAFTIYAKSVGLAFQVWDDVLDIISDTETLGKPQGSDIDEEKSTYPRLMGLENAQKYAKDLIEKAVSAISELPIDTELLEAFAHYIVERDH